MKKITQLDVYKTIRKEWGINPSTKVRKSGKKYDRNKEKRDWRKELDDL